MQTFGMDGERIAAFLVLLGLFLIVIVLVLREIACWYWKINRGINLLASIDARLASLERKGREHPFAGLGTRKEE